MRIKFQQLRHKHHKHHEHHHHHHHHNLEGEHHHDEHHEHYEYISDFCIEEDCLCGDESPVVSAIVTLIVNLAILYMGNFASMISVEWISKTVSKLDLVIRGSAEAWDSSFEGAEEGQTIKDLPFYVLGFFIDNNGVNYFYDDKASASLLELNTVTYNGIN